MQMLALLQNQKAKLQMLLVSQKRLPVVLEMATRFSKEKDYMGRSFACLKLLDLNLKNQQNPRLKPKYIQSSIGALLRLDSLACLIQAHT